MLNFCESCQCEVLFFFSDNRCFDCTTCNKQAESSRGIDASMLAIMQLNDNSDTLLT